VTRSRKCPEMGNDIVWSAMKVAAVYIIRDVSG